MRYLLLAFPWLSKITHTFSATGRSVRSSDLDTVQRRETGEWPVQQGSTATRSNTTNGGYGSFVWPPVAKIQLMLRSIGGRL